MSVGATRRLPSLCRFLDAGEYNGSHALDRPASKKRQSTEALKDYIAELKEELQDAEERLKDLEK